MNRPAGVTVIAVLFFLAAVLGVLAAIGMMFFGGFMATLMNQSGGQGSGAGAGLFAGLGMAFGIVVLVFAALYFLVGWGLLKLKEWARIVTIVLAALGVLGALFGFVAIFSHFALLIVFSSLVRLAICAWMIWYLLQPQVKAAFQAQSRPATA